MIRDGKQEQDLTSLSSYISKVLKLKFGKGPETCFATKKNNIVIVRIYNFKTPMEDVLCQNSEAVLALKVRSVLISSIFDEIKTDLSMLVSLPIESCYHDWDFNSNQGILLFVAGSGLELETTQVNEGFEFKLCQTVQSISENIHKRPKAVKILNASSTICVAESNDVLITTENLLYSSGYQDILLEHSHETRNHYNQFKAEFEEVMRARIGQFFLT